MHDLRAAVRGPQVVVCPGASASGTPKRRLYPNRAPRVRFRVRRVGSAARVRAPGHRPPDHPLARRRHAARACAACSAGRRCEPARGCCSCRARACTRASCRRRIDVVFLAADGEVLRVVPELRPWRAAACRGAHAVLELPPGTCARAGVGPGDRLDVPY